MIFPYESFNKHQKLEDKLAEKFFLHSNLKEERICDEICGKFEDHRWKIIGDCLWKYSETAFIEALNKVSCIIIVSKIC